MKKFDPNSVLLGMALGSIQVLVSWFVVIGLYGMNLNIQSIVLLVSFNLFLFFLNLVMKRD